MLELLVLSAGLDGGGMSSLRLGKLKGLTTERRCAKQEKESREPGVRVRVRVRVTVRIRVRLG